MYSKHIRGDNDSIANECAMDPDCKAFRYSEIKGIGYLCNDYDGRNGYEDWVLCEIEPGKTEKVFLRAV